MTRASDLTSIDCAACGAGIDVLGGGRVVVHICPYCGTELDALDGYRALRKFTDLKRPDTPFQIGMSGRLFGVDHTVIGTLAMEERYAGRVWTWVEHQLYSATHGYAWLTFNEGHVVFTRRSRDPGWMSVRAVESADTRPSLINRGATYKYYETSRSQIVFAEGEFTWAPRIDEDTTTVSALSEDAMLDFSETGQERETYRSVYLEPEEVEAAFGVSLGAKPRGTHPLQPFRAGPNFGFLRLASLACALLCLFLALAFTAKPGVTALPETEIAVADMPVDIPFDVSVPDKLVRIRLKGDGVNSWSLIELEVTGPDDTPLFETGRTVEYYSGRDSEGSWSEGSNKASVKFIPDETGPHTVTISVPEADIWSDPLDRSNTRRAVATSVTVSAVSGLSSGFWLFVLGLGFGAVGLYQMARKWSHNRARWAGSDWTDDD